MSSNYTRANRGSMTRQSRGTGDLPPQQNIVVVLDELRIAKKGLSTVAEDRADVYLMQSMPELGVTAEFDQNGAPLTKMTVRMSVIKEGDKGDRRRDIFGLSRPKGAGPAMDRGSFVIFEKVYLDGKTGELVAKYGKGGPISSDQALQEDELPLKTVFAGLYACVLPERSYTREGQQNFYQEVMVADQGNAELVTGDDHLQQLIAQHTAFFDENGKKVARMGTAGFQLHCRQLAADDMSPEEKVAFARDNMTRQSGFARASWRMNPEWKDENSGVDRWLVPTIDQLLDSLWASSPGLKDLWGQPGYQFEFVPMMVLKQAGTLIPSDRRNEKGKDNTRMYALYDAVDPNDQDPKNPKTLPYDLDTREGFVTSGNDAVGFVDVGWALTNLVIERKQGPSEEQPDGAPWYTTYQAHTSTRSPLFELPDMPTQHMPDYHVQAVMEAAARTGEMRRRYWEGVSALTPAPEPQPAGPGRR